MIRKQVILGAAAAAGISGVLLGGAGTGIPATSAYFTDREFHTNIYTFGDVTADGTETEWNPKEAECLLPKSQTPKNPVLVNTGDNAVIGFIVLDSPLVKEAGTADEAGNRKTEHNKELWQYLTGGTEGFEGGWLLTEEGYADSAHQSTESAETASFRRRVFGWKDSLPGRNGNEYAKTGPLFDAVCALNYVEGSVKEEDMHGINVYFLAVQADSLQLEDGRKTTEASTKNMSAEELEMIWKIIGSNAEFAKMPEAEKSHRLDLKGNARKEKDGNEHEENA